MQTHIDIRNDDPVAALRAAHAAIVEQLSAAEERSRSIIDEGATEFVRQKNDWNEFARFFEEAEPQHIAFEETELFPTLPSELALSVDRMRFDHRWLVSMQENVLSMLEAITRDSSLADATHIREFALLVREFVHAFRQHIRVEETTLRPALSSLVRVSGADASDAQT